MHTSVLGNLIGGVSLLIIASIQFSNASLRDVFGIAGMVTRYKRALNNGSDKRPFLIALDTNGDDAVDFPEFGAFETIVKILPSISRNSTNASLEQVNAALKHGMQAIFSMLDACPDGKLTTVELSDNCFIGWAAGEYLLKGFFTPGAACDLAGSACVGDSPKSNVTTTQRAMVAFKFQDENSDGSITLDEMANTYFVAMVYLTRDYRRRVNATLAEWCSNVIAPQVTSESFHATMENMETAGGKNRDSHVTPDEYEAFITQYF